VILFRICLASPGESDIAVQLNKNTDKIPDNEVYICSEWGGIYSLNDPLDLDRMHDFDDEFALADNLQYTEIPFGGIVRCGPNGKQLINDNSFPNQHLLTLKSDYSALEFAIKQYLFFGSSDLLTQQMRNRKIVLTQMWKDDGTGLIWAAMIIDTYGLVHVCVNPRTKAVKVVLSRHSVVFGHAL
jgi:hypothetical protein